MLQDDQGHIPRTIEPALSKVFNLPPKKNGTKNFVEIYKISRVRYCILIQLWPKFDFSPNRIKMLLDEQKCFFNNYM
jgi:hypothetical protein